MSRIEDVDCSARSVSRTCWMLPVATRQRLLHSQSGYPSARSRNAGGSFKRRPLWLALALLLVAGEETARADAFTFITIPVAGNVSGPAGSTIGWGYTIMNASSTNWLVTTDLSAGGFINGTPLAIFDFPILAPGATAAVPFDASLGSGLYQLTWNANAPDGFLNSGIFTVSAEWWTGDPFVDGNFLSSAGSTGAPYSAVVSATQPVPEPSTLLLAVTGFVILGLQRKKRVASPDLQRTDV